MFKRWQAKRQAKQNATNYQNSALEFDPSRETNLYNDKVNPPQAYCIRNNLINEHMAGHRAAQCRYNPYFWKLTSGLAEKLFSNTPTRPYPFMYCKPYDLSKTQESADIAEQTTNPNLTLNRGGQPPRVKSNGFPPPNLFNDTGAQAPGGGGVFGAESQPLAKFDLDDQAQGLHEKWLVDNMYDVAKRCAAKGLGVNSSVIVKTHANGKDQYWVFGRERIKKLYTKNRVPTKLDIEWPSWQNTEEIGGTAVEQALQTYTIGKDCVFFRPIADTDDPFGLPFILPFWDAGVSKQFGRFIHSLYMFKGGVMSKYYRIPNNLDSAIKERLELEAKKGMLSEAVILEFPPGASPEYIDKMFSHEEINGNDVNWDEFNTLNSQDTPFPKSFIEGQAESGALGGSAPEMDTKKEYEQMFVMFQYFQQLIKDINTTFYAHDDTNYIVIPWNEAAINSTEGGDAVEGENPAPKGAESTAKGTKEQESQKSNASAKLNSITPDGLYEYDAVLLPVGEWPYPTPSDPYHTEIVDLSTIKDYVDDPLSVKEGYVQEEHPDKAEEVVRDAALGTYKITGYDHRGMIGKIYTKESQGPEFKLSNFYYSHDETSGGKTFHRRIDYRNVVKTRSPRMAGASAKFT